MFDPDNILNETTQTEPSSWTDAEILRTDVNTDHLELLIDIKDGKLNALADEKLVILIEEGLINKISAEEYRVGHNRLSDIKTLEGSIRTQRSAIEEAQDKIDAWDKSRNSFLHRVVMSLIPLRERRQQEREIESLKASLEVKYRPHLKSLEQKLSDLSQYPTYEGYRLVGDEYLGLSKNGYEYVEESLKRQHVQSAIDKIRQISDSPYLDHLDDILDFYLDEDPDTRCAIAQYLASSDGEETSEILSLLFEQEIDLSSSESPKANSPLTVLLQGLLERIDEEEIRLLLCDAYGSLSDANKHNIIEAYSKLNSSASSWALKDLFLEEESRSIQTEIVNAIDSSEVPATGLILIDLLNEDLDYASILINALCHRIDQPDVQTALKDCFDMLDQSECEQIVDALGRVDTPESIKTLVEIFEVGTAHDQIYEHIIKVLDGRTSSEATKALIEIFDNEYGEFELAVAPLCKRINDQDVLEILIKNYTYIEEEYALLIIDALGQNENTKTIGLFADLLNEYDDNSAPNVRIMGILSQWTSPEARAVYASISEQQ